MTRILLVEDDESLGFVVKDNLEQEGYQIDLQVDGKAGQRAFQQNEYDLCIFDVMLPEMDGFTLAETIRKAGSDIPIIFLTAKSLKEDRIKGLKLGADDYLTKPFALTELSARLFAVIRRIHGFTLNNLTIHGFVLQLQDYKVSFNEVPLSLTKKEFDIFQYLVLNKNRVITRLQLTEHIWGDILEINSDSNFIDVHVRNLRKKLDKHTSIDWFETVRNVGYRINE